MKIRNGEDKILAVGEFFCGYGSQTQALKDLGIKHNVVCTSDVYEWANKSYRMLHGDVNNLGDITKINPKDVPYMDFMTYSFPCQSVSACGEQKGLEKGSGTKSSLLWHCEEIIKEKRPPYLMMENVKGLLFKKNRIALLDWLDSLSAMGYTSYQGVMNCKDYGLPHNRDRVFIISIHESEKGKTFEFPKPKELRTCIEDYLEDVSLYDTEVYLERDYLEQARDLSKIDLEFPTNNIHILGNRRNGKHSDSRISSRKAIIPCLMYGGTPRPILDKTIEGVDVIRKLKPIEYLRLMGMSDEKAYILINNVPKTHIYQMCGNSIPINMLKAIFKNLFVR